MTTIACRVPSLTISADSRETVDTDAGGTTMNLCEKLFRKKIGRREVIIGTAGGTYLGMVFVDWYKGINSKFDQPPEILRDAHLDEDFEVVILEGGHVYTANHLCRPVRVIAPFVAVGSGRKAAMVALNMGASTRRAVEEAARVDPYTGGPIITMRLKR